MRPGRETQPAATAASWASSSSMATSGRLADVEALPRCDWVIDAAANPSVLAGVAADGSSRQLIEHNLWQHWSTCSNTASGTAPVCMLLSTQPGLFHRRRWPRAAAVRRRGVRSWTLAAAAARPSRRRRRSPEFSHGAAGLSLRQHQAGVRDRGAGVRRRRSASRCGSTAAACWPGRASSARPIRGSSPSGSTPTCGAGRCGTSVSTARAIRCATPCIPRDLAALLDAADGATAARGGQRIYTAGGGPANAMSLAAVDGLVRRPLRPAPP